MPESPPAKRPRRRSAPDGRKQNHVAAEKKRREAIRQGFVDIARVVPDLDVSQSRSEAFVLDRTVALLKNLGKENKDLRSLLAKYDIKDPKITPQ